jgi:hypothetical protein
VGFSGTGGIETFKEAAACIWSIENASDSSDERLREYATKLVAITIARNTPAST